MLQNSREVPGRTLAGLCRMAYRCMGLQRPRLQNEDRPADSNPVSVGGAVHGIAYGRR
jgi:hypothetical protein